MWAKAGAAEEENSQTKKKVSEEWKSKFTPQTVATNKFVVVENVNSQVVCLKRCVSVQPSIAAAGRGAEQCKDSKLKFLQRFSLLSGRCGDDRRCF